MRLHSNRRICRERRHHENLKDRALRLLIALAFIFSYIESVLVIPVPVPGIKLGLANVVVVVALYQMGNLSAVFVSVIRVLLTGLTFGNPNMMLYSLAGCSLSLLVMILLKKTGRIGILGVSLAGGVMHNLGQIAGGGLCSGKHCGLFLSSRSAGFRAAPPDWPWEPPVGRR